MWLFTRYGFFSTACAYGKTLTAATIAPGLIMVRAHDRQHLEALRKRFPAHLGGLKIKATENTDFFFPLLVPKRKWAEVCKGLAAETNWNKFKPEAERITRSMEHGHDYVNAIYQVWGTLERLQRAVEGPADRRTAASADVDVFLPTHISHA